MSKRKYEKVKGYWVYSLYVPSIDSYYIGYSKTQCSQRWKKSHYKRNSLEPYIDEWDSMIKTVIQDNLTKEEAVKLEDKLIVKYTQEGKCINKQRSGWIEKNDMNAYVRELYHKNKQNEEWLEKVNRKARERYKTDEEYKEKQKRKAREYRAKNREEVNRKQRERRAKKKLENQQIQNQLTLFDLAS